MKYIAKEDTWFDAGIEVEIIDDYRLDKIAPWNAGLFKGMHEGILYEEVCNFEDFDEIE